jgi:hypothetical protein
MRTLFRIAWFLIAASSWPSRESEKPYGWPLTIQNGISSTFQEFRSNHFHAGIDLRTFQKTGFPVLAIADGRIERLFVSNLGFGRCLRLRHSDGNYSEYAHLERFRDDLEAIVARVQASRGKKYFGATMLPQPVAVRRGEVIAISGESGYGFPHLHLEIRDGADRAINPLNLIQSPSPDRNAPRMKGILLRSRGGSLVNGDCGEFYFKLRKRGDAYTLDEPLKIDGSCDITLHAVDLSDSGHVVAPDSLEASLDGRPIFGVEFERLSRDDNNQLGMLYDMAYSTPSEFFFNLCSQSGFFLERTGGRLAEEFQRLAPGPHELRIVVRDNQRNQALAVLPISRLPAGGSGLPERKHYLSEAGKGLMQQTEISTFINHDAIVAKMRDFPAPAARLKLRVTQGAEELIVPARECSSGVFFCFRPLNHELRMQLRFELSTGGLTTEMRQKVLHAVLLKNHYSQTVRLHDFAAEFGPTSVREPTALLLEPVALTPELPLLAGPVRSEPVHFAFLDAVFFKFKVPAGAVRREQLGIFKYHPSSGKWSYVPTQPDREEGYVSCRVLTAGTFALLRDVFPPAIRLRRPASRQLRRLKRLVVLIGDKGKGVNLDSLAVFLNGQKIDAEYDPDWGHVLLEPLPALKMGRNNLLVRVADLAGNHSTRHFFFALQ